MIQLEQEIPVESARANSVVIAGRRYRKSRACSSCRLLVFWKDYVVKVGDQGSYEVDRWNRIRPEHAKYFVPIEASGMLRWEENDTTGSFSERTAWVAQRRIPVRHLVPLGLRDEIKRSYAILQGVAGDYGVIDIDYWETPRGMALHNWTLFKGIPVIYDYGF